MFHRVEQSEVFEIVAGFEFRSPSPRPNDSLAPARSALSGLRFADSFRRFPSGSSPLGRGRNWVAGLDDRLLGTLSSEGLVDKGVKNLLEFCVALTGLGRLTGM